jgi:hypothetical protein
MDKIPIHKIQEHALSGIVLSRVLNDMQLFSVNHMHRHNYYLFFLQEKGENSCFIDFKEYKAQNAAIACILPGQVHYAIAAQKEFSGWVLEIDALFVKNEWKNIFDRVLFLGNIVVPDDETMRDLQSCIALLHKKCNPKISNCNKTLLFHWRHRLSACLPKYIKINNPLRPTSSRKPLPCDSNHCSASIYTVEKSPRNTLPY